MLLLAMLLPAACDRTPEATPPPPSSTNSKAPSHAPPSGPISACPVTIPVVAPDPPVPAGALFGAASAYGNAGLWVGGLGEGGVLDLDPEPDGYLGTKFGWYRITLGKLEITGRRLDGADARPMRSHVPDGYGIGGFQPTGIDFPGEGCWEVTGRVAATTLMWVTYVRSTR